MNKPEQIICAAIHYLEAVSLSPPGIDLTGRHAVSNINQGIVICGWRHANCMFTFAQLTGLPSLQSQCGDFVEGFLTSRNRFVDREEASLIAFNAKQIDAPVGLLFSEDLY